MTEKLLLNVKEVSKLIGLSERTVWKMSACGELPAPIRIGRSVRWPKGMLEQFITERQEDAQKQLSKRVDVR